jgi:hypothetical protein
VGMFVRSIVRFLGQVSLLDVLVPGREMEGVRVVSCESKSLDLDLGKSAKAKSSFGSGQLHSGSCYSIEICSRIVTTLRISDWSLSMYCTLYMYPFVSTLLDDF